jgi:hypothetical protein
MKVLKTNYNGTIIKCLDMPNTNNTLIVAPIDGKNINHIIFGKQLSRQIVNSENNTKKIYQKLKAKHNIYRSIIGV